MKLINVYISHGHWTGHFIFLVIISTEYCSVLKLVFFLAINDKMVAINLLKTMQSSSMNIAVLQQRVCLGPMLLTTKKSSVDHSWILIQQGNRTVQVSSLLVFNNLRNPCCILPPFYCMIWYVPVFHTFENQ